MFKEMLKSKKVKCHIVATIVDEYKRTIVFQRYLTNENILKKKTYFLIKR